MALIETAAQLIADEGPAQLTLRRLANEVGTSTMAVYTHFGGMEELRREVRVEGFNRLRDHLAAVPETDDPVHDLVELGGAYYLNAVRNPNLYRAIFMDAPVGGEYVGLDTFEVLVRCVQRCIDAGRFTDGDALAMAGQFWAASHGAIALQIAGLFSPDDAAACFAGVGTNLIAAFSTEADRPRVTPRTRSRRRDASLRSSARR